MGNGSTPPYLCARVCLKKMKPCVQLSDPALPPIEEGGEPGQCRWILRQHVEGVARHRKASNRAMGLQNAES